MAVDPVYMVMKPWLLRALLAFMLSLPVWGDNPTTVVTPQAIPDLLVNPGKGWVAYSGPRDSSPEVLALSSTGYDRFNWSELELAEGTYNWAPIDRRLAEWKAAGKPLAFGVMCLSSHLKEYDGYATPKWVFDAGAKGKIINLSDLKWSTSGVPGPKMVPDFSDPIFQQKLKDFMTALGARYDGNPDVAYVDCRNYGNWGEGHMYPFSQIDPSLPRIASEGLRTLIAIQHEAFPHTPVIIPWGEEQYNEVYDWAVTQGMGIRRDGICGNSDGSETARALGHAPGVFEFFDGYRNMKKFGWWDGHSRPGEDPPGFGHTLADCVEKGMPSYIGLGSGDDARQMIADDRPLVEKLGNRMGYHFILTRAELPKEMALGQPATISLTWMNDGVAPIYLPATTAFARLDPSGRPLEVVKADGSSPASWKSGKETAESAQVTFTKATPGTAYQLAIGLVQGDSTTPTIRLGIAGRNDGGWYPLGPVMITP
jgi:hypothetical protein